MTGTLALLAASVVSIAISPLTARSETAPGIPSQPTVLADQNDLHPRPLGSSKPTSASADQTVTSAAPSPTNLPIVRTTLALGGVLVLILALAALARRVSKSNPTLAAAFGASSRSPAGLLEVLGRYPLGRGQTLVLLKLDRRILLLSQTTPRLRAGGGGLAPLCEITDPDDVASILLKVQDAEGDSTAARFGALLDRHEASHPREADGVIQVARGSRQVEEAPSDEPAEVWDDRAQPPEQVASIAPPLRLSGGDAFAELRDRLAVARARHRAPSTGGRR